MCSSDLSTPSTVRASYSSYLGTGHGLRATFLNPLPVTRLSRQRGKRCSLLEFIQGPMIDNKNSWRKLACGASNHHLCNEILKPHDLLPLHGQLCWMQVRVATYMRLCDCIAEVHSIGAYFSECDWRRH